MKYTATNANTMASTHEHIVYKVGLACGFFLPSASSSLVRGLYFFHQFQSIYLVVNISIMIGSSTSQPRLAQSPHATQTTKAIYTALHAPQAIHPLTVTSLILSLKVFISIFLQCIKIAQRYKKKCTYARARAFFYKISCCNDLS